MDTEKTEKKDILNSKSLKVFIKNSLFIIGLFVVLYCGNVALLLHFGKNFGYDFYKMGIILGSPIIVLILILINFSCFVKKMSYWFTGNKKDEEINLNNINEILNTLNILKSNFVKEEEPIKKNLQNKFFELLNRYIKKLFKR